MNIKNEMNINNNIVTIKTVSEFGDIDIVAIEVNEFKKIVEKFNKEVSK